MPRRRSTAPSIEDLVGTAAAVAADQLFERTAQFFEGRRAQSFQALPAEVRERPYFCIACTATYSSIDDMEMINPQQNAPAEVGQNVGAGTCRKCFAFIWQAGEEKLLAMARARAAKAAQGVGARPNGGSPPPRSASPGGPQQRLRPWEILGVEADAGIDEIKKAYRKLASTWHPDMCPIGSPHEEVERYRARFEEATRAFNAMMKVRQPAT